MQIFSVSFNNHTALHISVYEISGYMALLACLSVNIQHREYTVCCRHCNIVILMRKCVKSCMIEDMFTSACTHFASHTELPGTKHEVIPQNGKKKKKNSILKLMQMHKQHNYDELHKIYL